LSRITGLSAVRFIAEPVEDVVLAMEDATEREIVSARIQCDTGLEPTGGLA
jgi:hypothetical protein